MNIVQCSSCGANIFFAKNVATGNSGPLNAKAVPVYHLNEDGTVKVAGQFFVSHFLSCPHANKHSKKPEPATSPSDEMPPVDQEPPPAYSDEERYTPPPSGSTVPGGFAQPMPFGKHKGTPLIKLPSEYIVWMLENAKNLRPPLRSGLEAALEKKRASKGAAR